MKHRQFKYKQNIVIVYLLELEIRSKHFLLTSSRTNCNKETKLQAKVNQYRFKISRIHPKQFCVVLTMKFDA